MPTDRDIQEILDRLDRASDYLTQLVFTGNQARTLANHVYELTEIRGEVGDMRDRLAKADADLRWEKTLRERVEQLHRQARADNTAMIQQREQIRAALDAGPPTIDAAPAAAAAYANGWDVCCHTVLSVLNDPTPSSQETRR